MVQNQDHNLIHALIVVEMEGFDLIKVFLQFNKPVLNVTVLERKLQTLALIAMAKGKPKPQKKYQLLFQEGLMMVRELDWLEKVKLAVEEDQPGTYIYL